MFTETHHIIGAQQTIIGLFDILVLSYKYCEPQCDIIILRLNICIQEL